MGGRVTAAGGPPPRQPRAFPGRRRSRAPVRRRSAPGGVASVSGGRHREAFGGPRSRGHWPRLDPYVDPLARRACRPNRQERRKPAGQAGLREVGREGFEPSTLGSRVGEGALHFVVDVAVWERLDGSGAEGHCEGASASTVGPESLKHSPHRIGNVNRMHRRPQVSRSNAVTRRARRPGIVTEAPHGASRLIEAGAREDVRSLPVPRGAAERRAHDGRPRGQTTSARTGAAAAGR